MKACRNQRCQDWINDDLTIPLCPCCRVAARYGAVIAFVVFFVGHILASVDWVAVFHR